MNRLFLTAALVLTHATFAHAHFIWASLDRTGKVLTCEIAESPGVSLAPLLPSRLSDIQALQLGKLLDSGDRVHVSGTVTGPLPGISLVYGVHGTTLIRWSARAVRNQEDAGKAARLPLEITLLRGTRLKVRRYNHPVANAVVEVYEESSATPIQLKTGKDGSAPLPSKLRGRVAIGVIAAEVGSGEYKGQHFSDKADMGTLTIESLVPRRLFARLLN